MPDRGHKVVVVAHCHLNVNTKVKGLACYAGARPEVVLPLVADGAGIVQLPCPEATFLGMRRWGMTVEQYDTAAYRRHCREILGPTVDTLAALADDGCEIASVLGVQGSPSCAAERTCAGYTGGELEQIERQHARLEPGRGVLVDVLREMLDEAGLAEVPIEDVAD